MLNVKTADLTNTGQKSFALILLGIALVVLYYLLPPLIVIFANLWILVALVVPLLFLVFNYEIIWSMFKRLSWNMTKKIISSDKLWYLWQGYNYLLSENERMSEDINKIAASRQASQRMLQGIVADSKRAIQEHELEPDPIKKRVLEVKVNMLDQQFKNIEPKVTAAAQIEKDLNEYYKNRVADTQILKISLDGKAQEYTLYKQMAEATNNASNWMKNSTEMRTFNESLKQIDDSLNAYTADIEDFKRNVLPKMSSDSTSRLLDAQEGSKLIEEYKKNRINL